MKTLVAKVQNQRLFQPGETVVVAVSGGADSVSLLDILTRLHEENLHLVVAHLNHGLRGEESDRDEEFVARLAADYRLPFVSQRVDVAALARSLRLSLEDAGRRARYEFLARTAAEHGAGSIALAHHRDDQAETVLIRLLRGSGTAGLSAMGSVSQGMLKRPLLRVSRAEIEQYLKKRGLEYRTDASNADTAILRNSIRHELLPLLARYNPNVSERLAATAEILAGDEELLQGVTRSAYDRLLRPRQQAPVSAADGTAAGGMVAGGMVAGGMVAGGMAPAGPREIALAVEGLAAEPRPLRLRLYRHALRELRGDLQRIGLSHLDAIDRLVGSERPNSRIKLPGACRVVRSYGTLRFTGDAGEEVPFETSVAGPGIHRLPDGRCLAVETAAPPASLDAGPRVAYLDPESAPFPWTVRRFLPGDRFRPLGMAGTQKVKDLLMNLKIPIDQRRRVALLVSAGRIVWLCGVKMGEDARVNGGAGSVLRVEILDVTP